MWGDISLWLWFVFPWWQWRWASFYVCVGYEHSRTFWGDKNVLYLNWWQPFHNCVHLSKPIKLYSSKGWLLLYGNLYLSISELKKKKRIILTNATTWLKLEGTGLSEISQPQKDKINAWFHSYEVLGIVKFIETQSRMVVTMAGRRRMGSCHITGAGFQLEKVKNFWRWMVVTVVQ